MMKLVRYIGAWGLLFILLFGIGRLMMADDMAEAELLKEELVRKQYLLNRLESLPIREARIRERLANLDDNTAVELLYRGDENALRTLIQRDLRQIAARQKLRLGSMRSTGRTAQSGLIRKTAIQVGFSATYDQMLTFFNGLEESRPMLRVLRFSVRVQRPSSEYEPAELGVTAEIVGYRAQSERGR